MRVLTGDEMSVCDRAAIEDVGIPSHSLMESAGRECVGVLFKCLPSHLSKGVLVLCGTGNNGGDGYVIARTLLQLGVPCRVATFGETTALSGSAKTNQEIFLELGGAIVLGPEIGRAEVRSSGVLVDAVFGTGLRGELREPYSDHFAKINSLCSEHSIPVIAVDIPSGVDASSGKCCGQAILADITVAIQSLKLGHVLEPAASLCGEVHVVDVGIPLDSAKSKRWLLDDALCCKLLSSDPARGHCSHKGTKGHLLVLGGAQGHVGAAKLSANAALRCGAGLVTMGLPSTSAKQIAPELEELMCLALPGTEAGEFDESATRELDEVLSGKKALVIGPGLGISRASAALLLAILEYSVKNSLSLVLDADALNILAKSSSLRDFDSKSIVVTPHPGEMARLLESTIDHVQANRLEVAEAYARESGAVVVLKGARTIISAPDGSTYISPFATEALATAGSGDVLAGIIGALMSRGFSPVDAASLAVFVHGRAGSEISVSGKGTFGVLAGDIALRSAKVLNELLAKQNITRIPVPGNSILALADFS